MKNIFTFSLSLLACVLFTQCTDKDEKHEAAMKIVEKDTANYTTIQWIDTLINFGTVKQGEKVSVVFHCKNTGNKPLLLTNVRPGCGCTVADYTKEAVLPGKIGEVRANFDSKNFCDVVHKVVNAASNSKNNKDQKLEFTGTITNCQSNDKVVMPNNKPKEKH